MSRDQNGSSVSQRRPKAAASKAAASAQRTVACVECAEKIPTAAKKCSKCGSHQDWRRHVPVSQSTLALAISLVALASSVALGSKMVVETASGLLNAPNTHLGIAVVSANERGASVFVSNTTGRNVVVKDITCGLNIPIDPDQINRDLLAKKRGASVLSDLFLQEKETIGVFIIGYALKESVVLPPNGRVLIEGVTEHITPPMRTGRAPAAELPEKVGSYCTASGIDEANEFSVGAVALPIDGILGLNVETFLNLADFSPMQLDDKAKLLARVDAVRIASRSGHDSVAKQQE